MKNSKDKLKQLANGTARIEDIISTDGIYYDVVENRVIRVSDQVCLYRTVEENEDVSILKPFSLFEKVNRLPTLFFLPHDNRKKF